MVRQNNKMKLWKFRYGKKSFWKLVCKATVDFLDALFSIDIKTDQTYFEIANT